MQNRAGAGGRCGCKGDQWWGDAAWGNTWTSPHQIRRLRLDGAREDAPSPLLAVMATGAADRVGEGRPCIGRTLLTVAGSGRRRSPRESRRRRCARQGRWRPPTAYGRPAPSGSRAVITTRYLAAWRWFWSGHAACSLPGPVVALPDRRPVQPPPPCRGAERWSSGLGLGLAVAMPGRRPVRPQPPCRRQRGDRDGSRGLGEMGRGDWGDGADTDSGAHMSPAQLDATQSENANSMRRWIVGPYRGRTTNQRFQGA